MGISADDRRGDVRAGVRHAGDMLEIFSICVGFGRHGARAGSADDAAGGIHDGKRLDLRQVSEPGNHRVVRFAPAHDVLQGCDVINRCRGDVVRDPLQY